MGTGEIETRAQSKVNAEEKLKQILKTLGSAFYQEISRGDFKESKLFIGWDTEKMSLNPYQVNLHKAVYGLQDKRYSLIAETLYKDSVVSSYSELMRATTCVVNDISYELDFLIENLDYFYLIDGFAMNRQRHFCFLRHKIIYAHIPTMHEQVAAQLEVLGED